MNLNRSKQGYWVMACLWLMMLGLTLGSTTGCTNLLRTLVVLLHDPRIKPEYDLTKKRVALITTVDGVAKGDASALVMANNFKGFIKHELKNKKVVFVDQEDVDRAFEDQPLDRKNYAEIGNQTDADCVVVIHIKDLKLKQNKTLYQGSCECSVSVYEPKEGKDSVFQEDINNLLHPSGGKPVTECTEAAFRGHYLSLLARRASRFFYKYDPSEDHALDAAAASL
ncbi:MAG: hypothetical protein LW724_06145 [Planctomycetaceae bacterium]|jgi:hypothetical protein|nr:hypothetical protein [Planctomycetaceae bacterium]